ncbi:hypothetical protein ACJJH9_12220 [Microbulbifer sp. DLAB2-AF]
MITQNYRLADRFKQELFKQDAAGRRVPGSHRVAADWFNNIILD